MDVIALANCGGYVLTIEMKYLLNVPPENLLSNKFFFFVLRGRMHYFDWYIVLKVPSKGTMVPTNIIQLNAF